MYFKIIDIRQVPFIPCSVNESDIEQHKTKKKNAIRGYLVQKRKKNKIALFFQKTHARMQAPKRRNDFFLQPRKIRPRQEEKKEEVMFHSPIVPLKHPKPEAGIHHHVLRPRLWINPLWQAWCLARRSYTPPRRAGRP